MVVKAQKDPNVADFFFLESQGKKFIWVGELKFAYAQRIINQFATQFSRVGLDEFEWLRRWSS
jgi:hypothetical protein